MAAISPLASWSDQGMPDRPQYSSVRRGSNMRRKFTLPVEPPVAMMTAFLALMFSLVPLLSDHDPEHPARFRGLPIDVRHPVLEQDLDARLFCRSLQGPHEPVARRGRGLDGRISRLAGLNHGPIHRGGMHFPGNGVSDGDPPEVVGRLVDEDHAVGHEPFEGGALLSAKARMISRSLNR